MHNRTTLWAVLAAAALALPPTSLKARVALQDDAVIEDGLVVVAAGNFIRKACDTITPRVFRAYSFARSLESRAKALGYTDAEIEAYLDSKPDKDRVKAKARAYLSGKGMDFDSASSICAVGLAEIESQSQIGVLLKAK